MQTQSKQVIAVADLAAVREFLVSGVEIPRDLRPGRPRQKGVAPVPFHHGIVRARTRSTSAKA